MGFFDDAIREHLELKRRHGASDDEIRVLEDELKAPAARPGEPDFTTSESAVAPPPTPEPVAASKPFELDDEVDLPPQRAEPPSEEFEPFEETGTGLLPGIELETDPGFRTMAEQGRVDYPHLEDTVLHQALPAEVGPETGSYSDLFAGPEDVDPATASKDMPITPGYEEQVEYFAEHEDEVEPDQSDEPEVAAGGETVLGDLDLDLDLRLDETEEEELPTPLSEIETARQEPATEPMTIEHDEIDEGDADYEQDHETASDPGPGGVPPTGESAYEFDDFEEEDEPSLTENPAEGEDAFSDWEDEGAPSEPVPQEAVEDLLEETPDFLRETPDGDQLWFEQGAPKDFDFDD